MVMERKRHTQAAVQSETREGGGRGVERSKGRRGKHKGGERGEVCRCCCLREEGWAGENVAILKIWDRKADDQRRSTAEDLGSQQQQEGFCDHQEERRPLSDQARWRQEGKEKRQAVELCFVKGCFEKRGPLRCSKGGRKKRGGGDGGSAAAAASSRRLEPRARQQQAAASLRSASSSSASAAAAAWRHYTRHHQAVAVAGAGTTRMPSRLTSVNFC